RAVLASRVLRLGDRGGDGAIGRRRRNGVGERFAQLAKLRVETGNRGSHGSAFRGTPFGVRVVVACAVAEVKRARQQAAGTKEARAHGVQFATADGRHL